MCHISDDHVHVRPPSFIDRCFFFLSFFLWIHFFLFPFLLSGLSFSSFSWCSFVLFCFVFFMKNAKGTNDNIVHDSPSWKKKCASFDCSSFSFGFSFPSSRLVSCLVFKFVLGIFFKKETQKERIRNGQQQQQHQQWFSENSLKKMTV